MLIFSDVDGTFLQDDGTLPFQAAELAAIAHDHAVVFASSRTGRELQALQYRVHWPGWAVAEDGAVLLAPDGTLEVTGAPLRELTGALEARGQGDVLRLLQRDAPVQADRIASLLLPRAVAEAPEWAGFRAAALSADLRCSAGGRWATLTRGADKGRGAQVVARRLGHEVDVAIGNDANDVSLLAAARRPFVIRNPPGHHPALARLPRAFLLDAPGPQGWKEMVRALQAER